MKARSQIMWNIMRPSHSTIVDLIQGPGIFQNPRYNHGPSAVHEHIYVQL